MKDTILVSGLINIETTLRITEFPLEYYPVTYPFFGVNSSVSGVGYNLAKALTVLGDNVRFLSLIGKDIAAQQVRTKLIEDNIPWKYVLSQLDQTAQSVILYDGAGRRQIHTDLKDIQEQAFPPEMFDQALNDAKICVLCNINFSRPLLARANKAGRVVATDVHAIADLDDAYNRDFMQAATILFMSDDKLPSPPEGWMRSIWNRYPAEVVVIGMGKNGALLGLRDGQQMERIPAVTTRPVVNTIGAGDALFASFLHSYVSSADAYASLRKAMVFASYKIGAVSAADGFLSAQELDSLAEDIDPMR